ncbi:hypothetical protein H7X87_02890 [Acetobacteraceae bacterium]|nr:hypothetical protein [Candidatus Parcubacteria bacterium]
MTDILQKLFGSSARVKLLRLFLFNAGISYTIAEVASRTRSTKKDVRREILLFTQIGLIERTSRKKEIRFTLKRDFAYLLALQNLLLNTPARSQDIYEQFRDVGAVRLVVIGGIFMGEQENGLDLFLVGDRVKEKKFQNALKGFEAEIGKELRYALLSSEDFFYRINMNDRLVRDVFDYPHRIVHDRLDIGLK